MNRFIQKITGFFKAQRLPKKRWLVVGAIIIYFAAKAYVTLTPTPDDDVYPDKARDLVVEYFGYAETQPDPSSDYDENGLRYGEGYA